MLNVFICEDRPNQREMIEQFINNVVIDENYDVGLAVSFNNAVGLLRYLNINPVKSALYFLDVDLQDEINGIELGAKIRELDVSATIVFITTHSEMANLTFKYKVEAMDYIVKGDIDRLKTGIKECIALAYQRYLNSKHSEIKYFVVNANGSAWNIPYDDILYFETNTNSSNKLVLHTKTGEIDFRSTLYDVVQSAPEFILCHKSFAVNPGNIKRVNRAKTDRHVEMVSGELIPVSKSRMSVLLERLEPTSPKK